MSIISFSKSTTSDTSSSDNGSYSDQPLAASSYDKENTAFNHKIFPHFTLTEESVIGLSTKRLKRMLNQLNLAKIHITPLVDIILQAASSCSEVEFKEKIRTNEPVCYISNAQYINAFKAAQILRDVNTELLQHEKPNSAIYSMNTRNSFIVNTTIEDLLNNSNLVTTDTIYIDRDTMRQLLELHELVTETICKLQKAEHIKTEALLIRCSDATNNVITAEVSKEIQSLPKKIDDIERVPQKSSCCLQFLDGNKLNQCICNKQHFSKYQEQALEPAENNNNKKSNDTITSQKKSCWPQFFEENRLNCNCDKGRISTDQKRDIETEIQKSKKIFSEKQNQNDIRDNSTNTIIKPQEPIDNLSNILLNTEMLPNEKQLTITPSDTIIKNFSSMSRDKITSEPSKKSSRTRTFEDGGIKNKKTSRKSIRDTGIKEEIKSKKSKKDEILPKKPKTEGKKQSVDEEMNKKSKSSIKSGVKNIEPNMNSEFLQKQAVDNYKEPDKRNKLNSKVTLKQPEESIQDIVHRTDNEFNNNLNKADKIKGSDKRKQREKSSKEAKTENKKNNKKQSEENVMTDVDQTKLPAAAGENVTKPGKMNKMRADGVNEGMINKDKVKTNNKKEKENKSEKNKPKEAKKKDSRKNSTKNEAVNSLGDLHLSQSNATVMQAPSIHVQNNDLATNRHFFQTNSNYSNWPSDSSKEKITSNSINLSTSVNTEIKKALDSRHALIQKEKVKNNSKFPDTSIAYSKKNDKSLSRKTPQMPRNKQIAKEASIVKKQNQPVHKALVIKDKEYEVGKGFQKAPPKEVLSTILKGATHVTQDLQPNNNFVLTGKDKYDNVADAKEGLLQCLHELTKIRSYMNDCDDPELRKLEQSLNVEVVKHEKNCGVDDAPHIHCNLQGIELTLKADKVPIPSNCPKSVSISKNDATSSTHPSFIKTPINSSNNIVLLANISNPSIRQTQTSVSDKVFNSFSIEAQTDDLIFHTLPTDTSKPSIQGEEFYDMFNPKLTSSYTEPEVRAMQNENSTANNLAKSIKNQESSSGLPYVVGIKSLPNMDVSVNASESMIISVDSMKRFMDTDEIYHEDEIVNRALNSIHINHLLLSCTPVACSTKTSLNDRRDMPHLPLKPSLTSLPLSTTDLVVIRQNIERKSNNTMNDTMRKTIYNYNTFEYYTNFQANFSSNREYFVPSMYLVYYFEFLRNEDSGDSDGSGKVPPMKGTHLTTVSTQKDDGADSEPEGKWSDFKLFDYIRKEFLSLRGDGPAPKTSNSINVKTSKGNRNKKIQVSLTKTIEIPVKSKRKRSRTFDKNETINQGTQSRIEEIADQRVSYCKLPDKQFNQLSIRQKHRTLHTQTSSHPSAINSLANIMDTIYETEFENPLQKSVQQIYNVPKVTNTPAAILKHLQTYPKATEKELIVETNQYEINDSLKPNNSRTWNTNLSRASSNLKNSSDYIYQSFIPRPKTSIITSNTKDESINERNILRSNVSLTRINKRSINKRVETKQIPSNTSAFTRDGFAPLAESSSDCEDVRIAGRPSIQLAQTFGSNLSQSKLISFSPKRHSAHNRRNIVRDKIKNLPVYNSESLNATLRRQQSFASSERGHNPSQVMFGCGCDNNTGLTSSIFNLPKKHSCGFLSVLSPTCGCPDVTVFIPCYCSDNGSSEHSKSSRNTKSLDILNKGVSGMYHVIMPPIYKSGKLRN